MNRFNSLSSISVILLTLTGFLFLSGGCDSKPAVPVSPSDETSSELHGPHPLRFPHLSIRTEKYLLPAVSTGPLDPVWSPDGQWIAFSMRGDLWKIPGEGGEAIALTEGPGYYFEPSWSPDGNAIAFSTDQNDRLAIGIVDADGKNEQLVVNDSKVNIEPIWSPDGESLYFVSDREGGLSIFKVDVTDGDITPVVSERGNQMQPAVSPDGKSLAYISPVSGKPGSGGIWVKTLPSGEPQLVHYEETRYRAAPDWTPDGQSIVYVSEITGNNDIGIIPAKGGAPVWLTHDEMNEYTPSIKPDCVRPLTDGKRILFVSNREGPTKMFTMPAGGGAVNAWNEVSISSLKPKQPVGKVQLQVVGPAGQPVPARVYLNASDGRSYAPGNGFHRLVSVGERHYFHTGGTDTITVPAGRVEIEAMKGFEYKPSGLSVEVSANGITEATLRLERLINPSEERWYSGETHAHDLHGGRYGLTHADYFKQLQAEDLHVTNALIHMDGTRLMGRWDDLTGEPHPLSTENHILQYGEEFRGSRGHVGLLGISEFILPFVGGERGTAYSSEVLNAYYIDEAEKQGGIGGFMHPYGSKVEKPSDGSFSEIPVDVALGKGSFYDVLNIPYDAFANVEMYYRLLNSGFRLAATGGSDPFADVWRDPPAGTTRTYAQVEGSLSVQSWLDAVKQGRTFATNGPLVFMRVEGREPGGEIRLTGDDPTVLQVQGEIISIAPLDNVEVVLNGTVVQSIEAHDKGSSFTFSVPVEVENNGWIAVRTYGAHQRYVTDSYPFAQTSPVYVLRNGRHYTSPEDAKFLYDVVEAVWESVENRDQWHSDKEKQQYKTAVEKAAAVYRAIAEDNVSPQEKMAVQPGDTGNSQSTIVPEGAAEVEQTFPGTKPSPKIVASFDGLGAGFTGPQGTSIQRNPSDNSLAVGVDHIVQTVNTRMAIFTKKGEKFDRSGEALYGPVETRNVFRGFRGPCEQQNNGDAVVRYDQLADRWLIVMPIFRRIGPVIDREPLKAGESARQSLRGRDGQPGKAVRLYEPPADGSETEEFPPRPEASDEGSYSMCYAVSTGPDPFGPYYRYEFVRQHFPDYPRPAVWPDGYYVPTSAGDDVIRKQACVVEREKMLKGEDATEQCVIIDDVNFLNNSDLLGKQTPPAGTPNIMMATGGTQLQGDFEDDGIYAWTFDVDWDDPANTKVEGPVKIPVAPYHYLCDGQLNPCVPQPGTDVRLDSQGDKIMARLVYRWMGNRASIVAVHSVNTSAGGGGVRWYEFHADERGIVTLNQQGTYAPDGFYRWMASPAIDASGNIGIGYSFGGTPHFAGQRFAGRESGDPRGQLTMEEVVLVEGEDVQTNTMRWEDYTQTAVDPSDDCTIWYVGDYYKKGASGYSTRIGAFWLPGCGD